MGVLESKLFSRPISTSDLGPPILVAFWFREMGPRKIQRNLGEGAIF